jgi:hypothetical protein
MKPLTYPPPRAFIVFTGSQKDIGLFMSDDREIGIPGQVV